MKVVDIAQEIYIDAFEPTYTSVPAIAFWIRGKVGTINNSLCEDFVINDNGEISNSSGCVSIEAVAVIKQYYRVYDLERQVNNNMNALAGSDALIEVNDNFGGASYRKVNRNEISKTIITLRKDEIKNLDNLIAAYKITKSNPAQVSGDDTIPAYYGEKLVTVRNV
jgi:hypothetical protein